MQCLDERGGNYGRRRAGTSCCSMPHLPLIPRRFELKDRHQTAVAAKTSSPCYQGQTSIPFILHIRSIFSFPSSDQCMVQVLPKQTHRVLLHSTSKCFYKSRQNGCVSSWPSSLRQYTPRPVPQSPSLRQAPPICIPHAALYSRLWIITLIAPLLGFADVSKASRASSSLKRWVTSLDRSSTPLSTRRIARGHVLQYRYCS